jgi:hypothetical protein
MTIFVYLLNEERQELIANNNELSRLIVEYDERYNDLINANKKIRKLEIQLDKYKNMCNNSRE